MPNVRRQKEYVEEWRSLWEADLEAIAYNGATCDPTRVDPKVLQWVKNNCAREPHFIKVINETASFGWQPPSGARDQGRQQCRLFVPRPFVREHFKKLGRVITLENGTTHTKFKVSFGVVSKVTSWLQGWKRVATGNKLTPGDVMIFVLVGDSHFLFHLFDEHGHPKLKSHDAAVKTEPRGSEAHDSLTDSENYVDKKRRLGDIACIVKPEPGIGSGDEEAAPLRSKDQQIRDPGVGSTLPDSKLTVTDLGEVTISRGAAHWTETVTVQQMSGEGSEEAQASKLNDSVDTVTKTEAVKEEMGHSGMGILPTVHELPLDPLAFLIKSRRRMPTTIEKKRAREMAKAHADLLVGYRFLVVLTEAQVYRDFHLVLPERFVSDTRLPTALTRLRLVDSSGKEWEMYSRRNSSGVVAFHRKYWGVFALEHRMEEGDVCLFQLKNKGALTISVRIFRVVQLPKTVTGRKSDHVSVHDHYDMRLKNHGEKRQHVLLVSDHGS